MVTGKGRQGRGWVCAGLVVVALFLALAFSPVGAVHAAGLSVTNCNATGAGSLVDTITTANTNADASNTITFAQDCSTTPILFTSRQTVSRTLTIDGTGHQVTIDGGGTTGLFGVNNGVTFAVNALTLTGGNAGNGVGGAISNLIGGTVTVTNSTLSGNSSNSGGGIFNQSGGTVTVTNSTLSGNSATYDGGGIYNAGPLNAANTLIVNSTSGDVTGNGINGTNTHNRTGSFTFANGETTPQDHGGPTRTLAIPTSGLAYQQGDLTTCQSLTYAGTMTPLPFDQRGANRVVGGTCSIGAYEPGPVITTTTLSATPTSGAFGTPVTVTATVAGVLGGTPPDGTNVVTFKNGTTTLGTANLTGGTATFTTSTLGPGNSVTATYTAGGRSNPYAASPASNAVSVTVTPLACVVTSVQDPSESGKLTLRDAINAANAGACTGNAITFDATAFPAGTAKTITLGNTLALSRDVTIDGTGHMVVIDGGCSTDANSDCTGGGNTVFLISGGNVTTLRALTIQHGNTSNNGSLAGGIYVNAGTLTVTNSTLAHNSTNFYGSGIFNAGTLTVTGSTIASNVATRGGGGIFNFMGTVTVTNSTLANNSTPNGGGGIYNGGAAVTVTNSTFAHNSATNGGGIYNNNGTVTVTNTILAGNPGSDVRNNSGTITGGGHNLVGTSSGYSFTSTGDTTGPALLAPLGSYGGSTQTFALLPGSAALGGGNLTTCPTPPVSSVDQRSVARPDAGTTACDIGAFESQGFAIAKGGDAQSVAFGSPFAPLTATVTSKDSGVTVNGGTLTFVIVPGSGSATFGAAGGTGCTVSVDKMNASGCTVNTSGVATSPPFTGTGVGGFTVTASATPGDPADAAYSETVTKAGTTTSVTAMPATSTFGQSVILTATVTSAAGTPTGSVAFTLGGTTLGSGTVNGTGVATLATTALPVGVNQTITATYSGDANFTTSSGTTAVTVNAVTITLTAPTGTGSGNSGSATMPSIRAGSSITLSANPSTGLTYTSSNANVAAVDSTTGVVTGIAPGTVTITASGPNGASGSMVITVMGGTGGGLIAPAPMAHPAGMANTAAGATPFAEPPRKADGTGGSGSGVQPQAVGATATPTATPQAAPARR